MITKMDTGNFSLSQLQHWMQDMLLYDAPAEEAVDWVPVESIVHASQRLSAEGHINIYKYSYIARLRSCMQSQFSALAYALSEDLFRMFADQYLDAYPSGSYSLNTLGQYFALFLEETRPDKDAKESWPDFMIELAAFEYSLSVVFDEQTVDNFPVATLDTPDKQLILQPVFRLSQHRFPVCDYYLAFSQGKEPELPFPEESYCVVTRRQYKLGLFPLRAAQYHFLKKMQDTGSFEQAKAVLIEDRGIASVAFDRVWPEWKKDFIASGFFVDKAIALLRP